jgi:UDP-N-acetylglucosamine--N-acetylmuramyl-(pentapeptide) pyrophosphoryl-undecaprenol N-acetylglucosamine transferase
MTQSDKTIIITGGHPTPAIAFIDWLQMNSPHIKIVFVGRRHLNQHEKSDTYEYEQISSRKIDFVEAKYKRGLGGLFNLLGSVSNSRKILQKYRADIVLSFGGYVGVPICISAITMGLPFFIHEQTIQPGLANRLLAPFARKVFTAFSSSANKIQIFPWQLRAKCIGNPIRKDVFESQPLPQFMGKYIGKTIFVFGGNHGSHAINNLIFHIIPRLVQKVNIVHQIGNVDEYGDWQKAVSIRDGLSHKSVGRYYPQKFFDSKEIASLQQHCDLLIGRSGANTVFELMVAKKPAILIPLPKSAGDEQRKHALFLADLGIAVLFDQADSPDNLFALIEHCLSTKTFVLKMNIDKNINFQRDAVQRLATEIFSQ